MSLAKLKKELKQQSKEDIINMVVDMYKKVPAAKDFLDVFVSYDVEKLIKKHEKEIERLVYPKGKYLTTKEVEARKLIRTLRKLKIDELSISCELYYVECCLEVIDHFGYYDDRYYVAIEKMYYEALDKIQKNGWEDEYEERLGTILSKASEFGLLEY